MDGLNSWKSIHKNHLWGVLASVLLLQTVLSQVAICRAGEAVEPNALRQAAQAWMRVGIEQYEQSLFEAAERSFRRAWVFQMHLTAAERDKLDELLAKARACESGGNALSSRAQTPPTSVEQRQPPDARVEEEVGHSESSTGQDKERTGIIPEKISSPSNVQEERKAETGESNTAKNQVTVIRSRRGELGTIKDLVARLAPYSQWLSRSRWELLAVAIIALVAPLLIAMRQRRAMAARMSVNDVPQSLPTVGIKLAEFKRTPDTAKRA